MKGNAVFPGKYLRADDLGGKEPVVTVSHIKIETLGEDSKPVLYFAGKERGLVLNKTNWSALVDVTGEEDSDDWEGKKVKLVVRKVEFQGKRVPAIRIEGANGQPHKPAPPVDNLDEPDDDEDPIPF